MKPALILSVLLAIACLAALLLCSRAHTNLHVALVTADTKEAGGAPSALLQKAEVYSDYSTYILLSMIPFFGVLIGDLYRLHRNTKKPEE